VKEALMPWVYLDLPLKIILEGPLHIGTGYDRGLVQRTVVRDNKHNVYIPGSSLKGKARNACEDLARQTGLTVCGLPRVAEASDTADHRPKLCLVCRIFGAPGGNAPDGRGLFWHNAHLTGEWRKLTAVRDRTDAWPVGQAMVRTQVQLSRARGIAAEDRLYTSEFAMPGLVFEGRVTGWLGATPCTVADDYGYYEVNLLLAGLRLVEMLGGGRSRGAGRCRIELPPQVSLQVEGHDESQVFDLSRLLVAAEAMEFFADEVRGHDG